MLTACRTTEATNAKWEECDFEKKVWTIPVERIKAIQSMALGLPLEIGRQKIPIQTIFVNLPIREPTSEGNDSP